jgi:hypothetical protein
VRFLPDFEGYFWIFPRSDHYSAGICGKLELQTTADLRKLLESLIREESLDYRNSTFYAHVLPNLDGASFQNSTFSGEGWAMLGDAAGFVDPVTGERYPDVIVFWVPSESDKLALVQDPGSPFFTTPHFDGHPSVLVRGSRIGELTVRELTEVIEDAWLSRASRARAAAWLSTRPGGYPAASAAAGVTSGQWRMKTVTSGSASPRRTTAPPGSSDRAR